MSAGFVTQLVSEAPLILVISPASSVEREVSHRLKDLGLDTWTVPPNRLLNPDTQLQLREKQLYKILWIVDNTIPEAGEVNGEIANWLSQQHESQVVAVPWISPIETTLPPFDVWTKLSRVQPEQLAQLQAAIPEATLAVIQDLVLGDPGKYLPLAIATSQPSQGIYDFGRDISFTSPVQAARALVKLLTVPQPNHSLIQGLPINSTELINKAKHIFEPLHQGAVPIVNRKVPPAPIDLPNFTVVKTSDSEFVAQLTAKWASGWPTQLKSTPTADMTQPLVAPNITRPAPRHSRVPIKNLMTPLSEVSADNFVIPAMAPAATVPAATPARLAETEIAAAPDPQPVVVSKPIVPTPDVTPEPDTATHSVDDVALKIFQDYRSQHKVTRVKKMASTTTKLQHKAKHRKKLFWAGVVFSSAAFGVGILAVVFMVSWFLFKQRFAQAVQAFDLDNAQSYSEIDALQPWVKILGVQTEAYSLVLDTAIFAQPVAAGEIITDVSNSLSLMAEVEELSTQAYLQLVGSQEGETLATLEKLAMTSQQGYEQLGKLQAKLKQLDETQFSPEVQAKIGELNRALDNHKVALFAPQQLHPLLPTLLGTEGKRTYAIVFQNSQELRPTGGFIQAIGLVTIDRGLIVNTQVFSVYDLDSKVSAQVAPPADLNRWLGEKQWYLRDSNWSPDFPTAAKQIEWFVEHGTNQDIDGVIGLNTPVLAELIKAVGPLELSDYNEVITDRNLAERLEFHSEVQLVPDPNAKDYSAVLLTSFLNKAQGVSADQVPELVTSINTALNHHQLPIALSQDSETDSITSLGWTGAVLTPNCPSQLQTQTCVVDTLAQTEANVGINKANIYVSRETDHQVSVAKNGFSHVHTVTFDNKSSSVAWPKGPYRNYMRFYINPNATVTQIKVGGQVVPVEQRSETTELGKKVVGVFVEVPIQKQVAVELNYQVPYSAQGSFSYAFFSQTQPGLVDQPQQIKLSHDKTLQPTVIAPQATCFSSSKLKREDYCRHSSRVSRGERHQRWYRDLDS